MGGGCIYVPLLVKLNLDLIIVRRGFLNFHRRTRVKLKVRANTSNMNILEDGKDISKVETLPSVHHTIIPLFQPSPEQYAYSVALKELSAVFSSLLDSI